MNTAYLLLGSNLEDRHAMLRRAAEEISRHVGQIREASSLYETEPWGFDSKHNFLNQVIRVETGLSPDELLEAILGIEARMGRKRSASSSGYSSRIIDIDILFFNDEIIRDEHLAIPHPMIPERMFTLVPLCELDASFIHPVYQLPLSKLKEACKDPNSVILYKS